MKAKLYKFLYALIFFFFKKEVKTLLTTPKNKLLELQEDFKKQQAEIKKNRDNKILTIKEELLKNFISEYNIPTISKNKDDKDHITLFM